MLDLVRNLNCWFFSCKGLNIRLMSFVLFVYFQDKLGLKKLNDTGRLHFLAADGDHLQFKEQWFIDNIIDKFLK